MNINDKTNFGVLQVFEHLIVFAHDNGAGQSGMFVDSKDFREMEKTITEAFKQKPKLRELFQKCVDRSKSPIIRI